MQSRKEKEVVLDEVIQKKENNFPKILGVMQEITELWKIYFEPTYKEYKEKKYAIPNKRKEIFLKNYQEEYREKHHLTKEAFEKIELSSDYVRDENKALKERFWSKEEVRALDVEEEFINTQFEELANLKEAIEGLEKKIKKLDTDLVTLKDLYKTLNPRDNKKTAHTYYDLHKKAQRRPLSKAMGLVVSTAATSTEKAYQEAKDEFFKVAKELSVKLDSYENELIAYRNRMREEIKLTNVDRVPDQAQEKDLDKKIQRRHSQRRKSRRELRQSSRRELRQSSKIFDQSIEKAQKKEEKKEEKDEFKPKSPSGT